MTGWQPISTAPKDGTWIVTYAAKDAQPGTPAGLWYNVLRWGWVTDRGPDDFEAWIDADGLPWHWPTHWMPLPEPPA